MEAHSLVKSRDIECYADPKMTFSVSEAGNTSIQHHVCTDEEAVESLVGRLRPFIVQSESIYLSKVLDAIAAQVPIATFTESEAKTFETTKSWFVHRYENKDSECYGIQLVGKEGGSLTDLFSDALLAESWVYTDTVHADPRGDKAEVQNLGYAERYRAGSSFFCEFACVVISLLNVVRALSKRGLLQVPDSIWNEAVTYAEAEKRPGAGCRGLCVCFPNGHQDSRWCRPQGYSRCAQGNSCCDSQATASQRCGVCRVVRCEHEADG